MYLYFFGAVAVIALVLFFIPMRWLRLFFRAIFVLIFVWGLFVITSTVLPQIEDYPASYPGWVIGGVFGLVWLFWARLWLHDLLLLIALAAAGLFFGAIFPPWTFMVFMLVIAVYDFLAVRFGFMVWMADRLSDTTTLPAFIFPRQNGEWQGRLQTVRMNELQKKVATEREYAILGGGDIGFPLILSASVFFASGLAGAVLVGAFALVGLWSAFLIQLLWLKGKPVPALPPIAFFCLIGLVIASFCLS